MSLAEHPTVRRFREMNRPGNAEPPKPLDAVWLRQLCLDCGADDAGLVQISRPALDDQRADILRVFPATKALLSFVCRMNREPVRSPARSVANLEFHHTGDHVNEVTRKVQRGEAPPPPVGALLHLPTPAVPPPHRVRGRRQGAGGAVLQFVGRQVAGEVGQGPLQVVAVSLSGRFFPPPPRPSSGGWRTGRRPGGRATGARSRPGRAGRPR